jgi:hypothetical protein
VPSHARAASHSALALRAPGSHLRVAPAGRTCGSHLRVAPAGRACVSRLRVAPAGRACVSRLRVARTCESRYAQTPAARASRVLPGATLPGGVERAGPAGRDPSRKLRGTHAARSSEHASRTRRAQLRARMGHAACARPPAEKLLAKKSRHDMTKLMTMTMTVRIGLVQINRVTPALTRAESESESDTLLE